jgi:hypothetical protein
LKIFSNIWLSASKIIAKVFKNRHGRTKPVPEFAVAQRCDIVHADSFDWGKTKYDRIGVVI